MKILSILMFFLLMGCTSTQTSKNDEINKINSERFDEYGACYIEYETGISRELLNNRILKRNVGFLRQSNGIAYGSYFDIFTTPNYEKKVIEVSTHNDYLELSMDKNAKSISKNRDFGASFNEKGNLTVGFFSTDKEKCMYNHSYWNGGTVQWMSLEILQSDKYSY